MPEENPVNIHRRIRNRIRKCDLDTSLHTVWTLIQNQEGAIDLPGNFQAPIDYQLANWAAKWSMVSPWQLEELAVLSLINSRESHVSKYSLGNWNNFARVMNDIKALENAVYEMNSENVDIWVNLHLTALRQFPWQVDPSEGHIVKYVKLYTHKKVNKFFSEEFQTTAANFFTILFALLGHFRSKPTLKQNYADAWHKGIRSEVKGFLARFSMSDSNIAEILRSE